MNAQAEKATPRGAAAWPIAVGTILVCFLAAVIGTGVWSGFQRVDLVSPDYYRMELHYNEQMQRATRGEGVAIEQSASALTLRFAADGAPAGGIRGTAGFYRPSDASLDFEKALQPDADGSQVLDTRGLRPGLWRVRLTWRANGLDHFREEAVVVAAEEKQL